jgi:outer membrane protein OmpA-like peptidoglycan-associated protein
MDSQGYYARLDVGWSVARDAAAKGAAIAGEVNKLGDSPILGAGLGYRFNRYFRADITSSYATSYELDDQDTRGSTWKSDVSAWTTLLNVYADYPMGSWSPYLMAGAGLSRNHTGQVTDTVGGAAIAGKTTTSFAWQAGGGVGIELSKDWVFDLGYRYLDAGQFKSARGTRGEVKGDLSSHVILAGLSYQFGGRPIAAATPAAMRPPEPPPPAPMPAPAPVAAPPMAPPSGPDLPVTYMVFFDWDRAEITQESENVIREAASMAKRVTITRIVATGHADRSGPDRYNMALSIRRAAAAKEILMREGIPETQIVIIGKGEREPLVPTADGVREPRNRRVEVVVQ